MKLISKIDNGQFKLIRRSKTISIIFSSNRGETFEMKEYEDGTYQWFKYENFGFFEGSKPVKVNQNIFNILEKESKKVK